MKEIRIPKVVRGTGALREVITTEADFKTSGDIEGVKVAETEASKTNTIIDLRIEIMTPIGNGDKITAQVTIIKVTEGANVMIIAAIITIGGITI